MNKIVNGVANDYEFPFLEKTTENYYQVMNRYYTEEFVKQLQQELQRKDNNWNELKEWLNEPHITYNFDASEFGIEKIECVSIKDTLNKIKELESK
jgi:hypothetical protein